MTTVQAEAMQCSSRNSPLNVAIGRISSSLAGRRNKCMGYVRDSDEANTSELIRIDMLIK